LGLKPVVFRPERGPEGRSTLRGRPQDLKPVLPLTRDRALERPLYRLRSNFPRPERSGQRERNRSVARTRTESVLDTNKGICASVATFVDNPNFARFVTLSLRGDFRGHGRGFRLDSRTLDLTRHGRAGLQASVEVSRHWGFSPEVTILNTYFITAASAQRRPVFQTDKMARLFLDVLFHYRDQKKYDLHEFVLMPDHFHALLTSQSIEKAAQFIKGGFSYRAKKELNFNGDIWAPSYHDRRVRDWEEYSEFRKYIRLNPVRARLCGAAEQYPYSSAASGFILDPLQQILPRAG